LRATVERQQQQIDALTAQINQMRANAAPVVGTLAGGVVANAESIDENASKIEFMQASAEAQQAQIDSLKKQVAQNAPGWKGAPEFKGSSGWSFKLKGEAQFDFGYVSNPNNAINTSNLGYNGIARRILFGAQGAIPGGFTYNVEMNFAGSAVSYEDVVFAYEPAGKEFSAQVGYMYPFSSLDNMTSNKFVSVVERSQLNDAFNNGRRLGAAVGYTTPVWRINAGVFNGQMNGNSNNTDWEAAVRGVYYPQALGGQLHFGASYQYRQFLRSAQSSLYQARPFTQTTNIRFVGTGPQTSTGAIAGSGIAASGDQIFGAELAGIWGPLHFQSELQYLKVAAIDPTAVLTQGNATAGQRLLSDPSFFSVYGEVGYWFTGETRGYKQGKFDRTKILNPFDKGGWGGFQVVGRIDYLNLNSYVGAIKPGVDGAVVNGELNGGKQTGYLLALNWWPTDYVRFTTQYSRSQITGGPSALAVVPNGTTTDPLNERGYGVNVVTLRAQLDF
jgi:phosphate-selective porin OprO/OprP